MYCVVDVHAGKDCEDVGLEECNQELKRGDRDRHDERQDRAANTKRTKRAQRDNEACENLECDVACQHVREKTNRKADWARKERDDFNGYNQRHNNARDAAWYEQLEEAETMLIETVNNDRTDNQQSKCKGYDDLAGDRVEIRNRPMKFATSTNMNSEKTKGRTSYPLNQPNPSSSTPQIHRPFPKPTANDLNQSTAR